MAVSEVHPQNAPLPSFVRLSGNATDVREEQCSNAPTPSRVRLSGNATDVREEHPQNTPVPSCMRLSGNTTDVKEEQSVNKRSPRYVSFEHPVRSTWRRDLQPWKGPSISSSTSHTPMIVVLVSLMNRVTMPSAIIDFSALRGIPLKSWV